MKNKMTWQEKLQHKYALSKQGATDMMYAFISATISNIVLMLPVGVLYCMVRDYMNNTLFGKALFYAIATVICLVLIAITTYIQYNATFLSTYVESGVRRLNLAEKMRKLPLSYFGKKDLSVLPVRSWQIVQRGNCFFSLDTGTDRFVHFYYIDRDRTAFL